MKATEGYLSFLLPAGEFGGKLGEQIGGRTAARVWQGAGIVG